MAIEWRVIPGYECYSVSESGCVKRIVAAKGAIVDQVLKPGLDKHGYPVIKLQQNGKQRTVTVHILVALAFLSARPSSNHEIRHRDGNRLNSNFENLCWGTRKDNEADKIIHGTHNRGERHGCSKLTADQVIGIRRQCMTGLSQRMVARNYGISCSHVSSIMSGRAWKHLEAA